MNIRDHNIDQTRRDLEQALELLNKMTINGPNIPTDISGIPIHGIRVLEKLKIVEVWQDGESYYAIARS